MQDKLYDIENVLILHLFSNTIYCEHSVYTESNVIHYTHFTNLSVSAIPVFRRHWFRSFASNIYTFSVSKGWRFEKQEVACHDQCQYMSWCPYTCLDAPIRALMPQYPTPARNGRIHWVRRCQQFFIIQDVSLPKYKAVSRNHSLQTGPRLLFHVVVFGWKQGIFFLGTQRISEQIAAAGCNFVVIFQVDSCRGVVMDLEIASDDVRNRGRTSTAELCYRRLVGVAVG